MSNPVTSLISSPTARVAPDLLKALTILSDTTVRSAVDREDLKPYWKNKIGHISLGNQENNHNFFSRNPFIHG